MDVNPTAAVNIQIKDHNAVLHGNENGEQQRQLQEHSDVPSQRFGGDGLRGEGAQGDQAEAEGEHLIGKVIEPHLQGAVGHHVDGEGTVLTTEMCLLSEGRNPDKSKEEIEQMLCDYLNCEKVIWIKDGIDPNETNGHIDDVACFVAPGEVACIWTEDPENPFYEQAQAAYRTLCESTDAKGRKLKVHKLCLTKEPCLLEGAATIDAVEGTLPREDGEISIASYMWIKYEYPDVTFEDMCKVFGLPKLRKKAHFCAISSTSGTATEVTAFSIITDYSKGIKYPIADFEITPDVAIVDPDLAMTMPKKLAAHTGMDAMTHSVEAYVSTAHCDFTDALALHSIKMVQRDLIGSYSGDAGKRESMVKSFLSDFQNAGGPAVKRWCSRRPPPAPRPVCRRSRRRPGTRWPSPPLPAGRDGPPGSS